MTENGPDAIARAYDSETQAALREALCFFPPLASRAPLEARREELSQVDFIFSTWGMLPLNDEELERFFPRLRAVFYAAGTVQYFARPFLKRGVRIFSAYGANAVPVAEYAAAQILLANKGFFQASRRYAREGWDALQPYLREISGNYRETVGLLGAGAIGKLVIERLKPFDLQLLVFDPFLPEERAASLGVRLASLQEVFSQCQTISNHLANNAQTQGILNYGLFSLMKPTATFLNTGRGAQVVEADLVRALKEAPGRTAVLDVTWPEPVEPGHPFLTMENVFLTPHIAGSVNGEIARMGRYMLTSFRTLLSEGNPPWEVTLPMLATMA